MDGALLTARLFPTIKRPGENLSVHGNPYDLVWSLELTEIEKLRRCRVVFKDIRVKPGLESKTVNIPRQVVKFEAHEDKYRAPTSASGVRVDHVNQTVSFDFVFLDGCEGVPTEDGHATIELEAVYKEEKITWIDVLLSV